MTQNQRLSDDEATDELIQLKALVLAVAGFGGSIGIFWTRVINWLIEHKVLVSVADDPVLTVPGGQGAGMDWARVVIAVAVLVALIAAGVSAVLHLIRNRRRRYR